MTNLVRILGWVGNLGLATLLLDGFFELLPRSFHVRWGLGVLTFLPLVYLLPYFHLIGITARLSAAVEENLDKRDALHLAQRLKARLFWPTLIAVIASIVGPVLAFIGGIPPIAHGIYMIVFSFVHVMTWVRSLFVLDLADGITALDG